MTCPVYAGMHLLVYLWPRAARLDAFLTGRNVAEFAWPPYFTDLRTIPVIGKRERERSEASLETLFFFFFFLI